MACMIMSTPTPTLLTRVYVAKSERMEKALSLLCGASTERYTTLCNGRYIFGSDEVISYGSKHPIILYSNARFGVSKVTWVG